MWFPWLLLCLSGLVTSHYTYDKTTIEGEEPLMLDVDKFFDITNDLSELNFDIEKGDDGLIDLAWAVWESLVEVWEETSALTEKTEKAGYSCPYGELLEHGCYWIPKEPKVYDDANMECNQNFGHLAILDLEDDELGPALLEILPELTNQPQYWIDGIYNAEDEVFEVSNGLEIPLDHVRFGSDPPTVDSLDTDGEVTYSLVYLPTSEDDDIKWEIKSEVDNVQCFILCKAKAQFYLPTFSSKKLRSISKRINDLDIENQKIQEIIKEVSKN